MYQKYIYSVMSVNATLISSNIHSSYNVDIHVFIQIKLLIRLNVSG